MASKEESAANSKQERVRYWLGEIAAARKRETDFRKDGQRVLDIYNGKMPDQIPFNILYSNTETLQPALYNSQPRPVVGRRFKDEDPMGKAAAMAGQRALEYLVDTNSEEYSTFDDVMTDAVMDALLPGRAGSRVKYDAKTADVPAKEGAPASKVLLWELVCFESLKWDRWTHGYAKKWRKVPWIAFEHDVTEDEAEKLFGKSKVEKMAFTSGESRDDEEGKDANKDESAGEDQKTARVYEVWVKKDKEVLFISPTCIDEVLKTDEDPLALTGFFPMPEPLRFLRKSNDLSATAIYKLYENQAKELNRITTRINRIVNALKVRGAYDSTLGEDIANILTKDDNIMVPATNVAGLQEGGLEKAIWLMPIDKLVTVFQQLVLARQQCKNVIYEITGISDILRGQTVASETATAQEIKSQWGTLRIKRLQKDVQRYVRDTLRIALELAANKFNERTFQGMTGLPFATTLEKQAAASQITAAQQMQAVPPPEAAAVLQKPGWGQILELLRDDTQRQYRIDIETNSTIDLEATEDQKNMGEVLQAISQFIQGVAPLIESGVMPFQVAQSMLLGVVRRYRFGSEVEDYIKAMQQPKPQDDGKAAAAAADAQLRQKELEQKDKADVAAAMREDQKAAADRYNAELDRKAAELQAMRDHALRLAEIDADKVAELAKLNATRETERLKITTQRQTELDKAAMAAAVQIETAKIAAAVKEKADNAKAANDSKVADNEAAATEGAQKVEAKGLETLGGLMEKVLDTQQQLLEMVSAETVTEVDRGSDGKIAQLRKKPMKKASD